MEAKQLGRRGLALCLVLAAMFGMTASALGDAIQMKADVRIEGDSVRLGDIAVLVGDDAEAHSTLEIASMAGVDETTITMEQVRRALSEKRVNWARLALRGFETCRVSRKTFEKPSESKAESKHTQEGISASESERVAPVANPVEEVRPGSQESLRSRLMTWLEQVSGAPASDFRIECSSRDEAVLDANAQLGKVSFSTSAAQLVGRVPVMIEQFQGDKLVKSTRVTLTIARRRLVVTAAKAVDRGNTISPQDVEIREVFVERAGDEPATRLDEVIGQQATSALRDGQIIAKDDVQPSLLVERYQIVRVKVVTDTIVINLEARALEDGARDQFIKVRNEASRETFLARVSGPRLVVVSSADNAEKAPASDKAAPTDAAAPPAQTQNTLGRK